MTPDRRDRMLLVGQLPAAQVAALAGSLTHGSLCVLVPADAVAELRRELREVTNVMVVPEDPEDGAVPWADAYFTRIWAPGKGEITPELQRVLQPGGAYQG